MNNGHQFHIAAILWRGNKPVITTNSDRKRKNFARFYTKDTILTAFCTHAEMEAIRYAKPGDKIEVIRWRKDGTVAMAKPCAHCQLHLKRAGITKVKYTTDKGTFEYL